MIVATATDENDGRRRYATKEQALAGHERMVTKWTGWTPGEPEPEED